MKSKILSSLIILTTVILFSCTTDKDEINPLSSNTNQTLAKKTWQYTSQNWPSSSVTLQPNCLTWNRADVSLNVSFLGYNFTFTRGNGTSLMEPSNYSVIVNVNGTNVGSTNNQTDYINFTYNGLNMSVTVFTYYYYSVYNSCQDRFMTLVEPTSVDIDIENYVSPDVPTGFSVSPIAHNNLNQTVTVSWDVSSDTDVTGYKIYRKLQTDSNYSLIQTINSRTTSSWIDSSVPWSISSPEMSIASYKMVAYDGTHNLTSNYTSVRTSAMP